MIWAQCGHPQPGSPPPCSSAEPAAAHAGAARASCPTGDLLIPRVDAKSSRAPSRRIAHMYRALLKKTVRFLKKEDGPTAVEYAVMLALIIVVCIVAITALGSNANEIGRASCRERGEVWEVAD